MSCKRLSISFFDDGKKVSIEAMDRHCSADGSISHVHSGRLVVLEALTSGSCRIAKSDMTVIVPDSADLMEKVKVVIPQVLATCKITENQFNEAQILDWIKEWYCIHGAMPTAKSGKIPSSSITWRAVDKWLRSKKSTLALETNFVEPRRLLLQAFRRYSVKESQNYDPKFDKTIREKQPHWFEKAKRTLLDMPPGNPRPSNGGCADEAQE